VSSGSSHKPSFVRRLPVLRMPHDFKPFKILKIYS
jgi:hypothetical protein